MRLLTSWATGGRFLGVVFWAADANDLVSDATLFLGTCASPSGRTFPLRTRILPIDAINLAQPCDGMVDVLPVVRNDGHFGTGRHMTRYITTHHLTGTDRAERSLLGRVGPWAVGLTASRNLGLPKMMGLPSSAAQTPTRVKCGGGFGASVGRWGSVRSPAFWPMQG
jgi:hypothetical protein